MKIMRGRTAVFLMLGSMACASSSTSSSGTANPAPEAASDSAGATPGIPVVIDNQNINDLNIYLDPEQRRTHAGRSRRSNGQEDEPDDPGVGHAGERADDPRRRSRGRRVNRSAPRPPSCPAASACTGRSDPTSRCRLRRPGNRVAARAARGLCRRRAPERSDKRCGRTRLPSARRRPRAPSLRYGRLMLCLRMILRRLA